MKLITANKLKRLWNNGIVPKLLEKLDKTRVLTSKEQVQANTNAENVVGALVAKELINDLAQQPEFLYDSSGKITGYKSPGGADTVFPFSGTAELLWSNPTPSAVQDSIEIPVDFSKYNKFLILSCTGFNYAEFNGITCCDANASRQQYVMVPRCPAEISSLYSRPVSFASNKITISKDNAGSSQKYNIILKVWGINMDTDFYSYS